MRLLTVVFGLAASCLLATLSPPQAEAQPAGGVYKCATAIGTTTTYTPIGDGPGEVQNVATQCKSSILLVFDGNVPATNNVEQQIRMAVDMCGLWDGPYRRVGANAAQGNPNYDYVVGEANNLGSNVNSTATGTSAQIGITGNPGLLTLSASVTGSTSSNSANITVNDTSTGGPSQILDFPGFEFIYGMKSQGGGNPIQATLICAVNAWYSSAYPGTPVDEETPPFARTFGISNYPFAHNINSLSVGWGPGPSGLKTQANITSVCNSLNGGLTQANQFPADNDNLMAQQQYVGKIYGTYKHKGSNPPPPFFNVSNCSSLPADYERVCSTLEPPGFGRPNSCNPDGGVANGISASIVQTQSGLNSHCAGHYSFSTGFGITSYGKC